MGGDARRGSTLFIVLKLLTGHILRWKALAGSTLEQLRLAQTDRSPLPSDNGGASV